MNDASFTAVDNAQGASPDLDTTENTLAERNSHRAAGQVDLEEAKRLVRDQKINFLDHLIRSIDIMVYCELSILYYMDCSMIKFLVRALPHWLHFTPKPDIIPPIPSDQRPYVSTILGTNIFCILLHLVFNPPAAGEAMRGYLHGGLMIDFVGQSSPVSRWHLLGLDLMCLALQVLIMCVILEKQKVLGRLDATTNAPEQRQDHDAEEAGVIRSESLRPEAIELQSFGPQGEHIVQDHVTSTQTLGLDVGGIENRHVLDHFGTGEYVVAQFCVPDIMRTQWNIRKSDMISVPTTGAQNVAGIARRRFTATFRASTMVPGSP